ncbi:MAG: prolyl oligopeptidase family serine peptidase [Tissierellia bacterium]|nr:prolyl oligopeptidase family serine peptidase [Tissierellia bacterium]
MEEYFISKVSVFNLFNVEKLYSKGALKGKISLRTFKMLNRPMVYRKISRTVHEKDISMIYLHGGPKVNYLPRYNHLISELATIGDLYYLDYTSENKGNILDNGNFTNRIDISLEEIYKFSKSIKSKKNILIGESYGAYLAFLSAINHQFLWSNVVLISPLFSIKNMKKRIKTNMMKEFIISSKSIKIVQNAIMKNDDLRFTIVHSMNDYIIPYAESLVAYEYLVRKKFENIEMYLFEGDSHYDMFAINKYFLPKLVLQILEE